MTRLHAVPRRADDVVAESFERRWEASRRLHTARAHDPRVGGRAAVALLVLATGISLIWVVMGG